MLLVLASFAQTYLAGFIHVVRSWGSSILLAVYGGFCGEHTQCIIQPAVDGGSLEAIMNRADVHILLERNGSQGAGPMINFGSPAGFPMHGAGLHSSGERTFR